MDPEWDIAIVGGGAAGLMAAICAGRSCRGTPTRITVLDGAHKIGAKILIAGGGRCNVTHDEVRPDDFFGGNRNQIAKVLRTFSVAQTVAFFEELGVRLKTEETGKLFPVTDRAQAVLDALLSAAREAGVTILTNRRVHQVGWAESSNPTAPSTDESQGAEVSASGGPRRLGPPYALGRFELRTNQGTVRTKALILATGGKSLPKTGSDGLGYELAAALGHTITPTTPGLVPLVLPEGHYLTQLSGISRDVELTLASPTGKVLRRQPGSMLFTHFGISGPAVLDISRHWIAAHAIDPAVQLTANLLPPRRFDEVEADLRRSAENRPTATVAAVLRDRLPERLAAAVAIQAGGVDPATVMARLSKDKRRALARALTALPLPVIRDRGNLFAEVTAGGVPLSEVDVSTMVSRRRPGLWLCGEILDVDGRVGGYNFQWAWCTGRLAGLSAARRATGNKG